MGDERAIGALEAGFKILSDQLNKVQDDIIKLIEVQSTLTQEVRHLKESRAEERDTSKNRIATWLAVGSMIIALVAVLAQILGK